MGLRRDIETRVGLNIVINHFLLNPLKIASYAYIISGIQSLVE